MVTCIAKGRKVKKTAMNFASFVILAQRVLPSVLIDHATVEIHIALPLLRLLIQRKMFCFFLMTRIPLMTLMVNSVKNITKTKVLKGIRLRG